MLATDRVPAERIGWVWKILAVLIVFYGAAAAVSRYFTDSNDAGTSLISPGAMRVRSATFKS